MEYGGRSDPAFIKGSHDSNPAPSADSWQAHDDGAATLEPVRCRVELRALTKRTGPSL